MVAPMFQHRCKQVHNVQSVSTRKEKDLIISSMPKSLFAPKPKNQNREKKRKIKKTFYIHNIFVVSCWVYHSIFFPSDKYLSIEISHTVVLCLVYTSSIFILHSQCFTRTKTKNDNNNNHWVDEGKLRKTRRWLREKNLFGCCLCVHSHSHSTLVYLNKKWFLSSANIGRQALWYE